MTKKCGIFNQKLIKFKKDFTYILVLVEHVTCVKRNLDTVSKYTPLPLKTEVLVYLTTVILFNIKRI